MRVCMHQPFMAFHLSFTRQETVWPLPLLRHHRPWIAPPVVPAWPQYEHRWSHGSHIWSVEKMGWRPARHPGLWGPTQSSLGLAWGTEIPSKITLKSILHYFQALSMNEARKSYSCLPCWHIILWPIQLTQRIKCFFRKTIAMLNC